MNFTIQDLIDAVRAHALKNYEENGWGYVVEAWTDTDIHEAAFKCRTPEGAIKKIGKIVKFFPRYPRSKP